MNLARVIDYETNGLPEDADPEVIEMGCVDVDISKRHVDTASMWSSFCLPRGPITAKTRAIHHITDDDVRYAPQARDLWADFFHGAEVLVAHQADFEKHFHPGDGIPWIDTYKVARIVWPDSESFSNQFFRYALDLPVNHRLAMPPHRALPDAYVTAHLFVRLLEHETIERMIRISQYPALVKRFTFGKHKGQTFEEVPISYLQWIADEGTFKAEIDFSAKYWIKKRKAAHATEA